MARKESPAAEIVEAAGTGEVTKQNKFSNSKMKQLSHRLLAFSRKKTTTQAVTTDGGSYHSLQAAIAR